MDTRLKRIMFASVMVFGLFALSSCSAEDYNGVNVLWRPVVWLWNWLWGSFTPGFWKFMHLAWTLPGAVVWLVGPLAYLLGGLLYLALIIIGIVVLLALAIIIAVLWFIAAIFNGIFHFV